MDLLTFDDGVCDDDNEKMSSHMKTDSYNEVEDEFVCNDLSSKLNALSSKEEQASTLSDFNEDHITLKRKDTKDSGYCDNLSEREYEQEAIPLWCQQYELKASEEGSAMCVEYSENNESNTSQDCYASSDDEKSSPKQSNKGDWGDWGDGVRGITGRKGSRITGGQGYPQEKQEKRQRRITPVPLSTPSLKPGFLSKPHCLFVEEEDADDINNFNSEDDFLHQSFISTMAESVTWKQQSLQDDKASNESGSKSEKAKLYQRSKSENDVKKNKKIGMFHEVPDIELIPSPPTLPNWMKEASSFNVYDEASYVTDSQCILSKDSGNTLSVECLQQSEFMKEANADEDILKIYLPSKDDKTRKGSRVRKLTPARPTSPSLDKLSDLHRQVSSSSFTEDLNSEEDQQTNG
eukprot:gene17511-19261_t